ncbi:SHOCT-like domain-containing protein [Paenibacillus sacheonensis]|uniref:YvlB/LiaX N-terminal domain-containing protein n=1 Tax=Paenibacillus sacheonensis TaxID=742054 RepID=A0A7X4YQY0_9BACL|nr:hypothetical protein [Paenibacillus sacheonensis]MBM7567148.1 hypothetical protein [Paenibacillus sacheonensis]NBC70927.1 hypothetical protein [Paenibacillus sacheonensis]
MKEEIGRVLSMLQEGKIDSDKASELINALKQTAPASQAARTMGKPDYSKQPSSTSGAYLNKTLKVRVNSQDNESININVPMKLVKAVLGAGHSIASNIPQAANYVKDIDIALLIDAIENELDGQIVDIRSGEETITVVIE